MWNAPSTVFRMKVTGLGVGAKLEWVEKSPSDEEREKVCGDVFWQIWLWRRKKSTSGRALLGSRKGVRCHPSARIWQLWPGDWYLDQKTSVSGLPGWVPLEHGEAHQAHQA